MVDFYTVGILSVDRPKRELRVWVCRTYEDWSLPETYSFFAGILYDMFADSGQGNVSTEYYNYSSSEYYGEGRSPLLPKVTAIAEAAAEADDEDDDDSCFDPSEFLGFEYESPTDSSPFIEHVEMLRWSDESTRSKEHEEGTGGGSRFDLQAEYLVRLTDDKYLSCRADPSFLGKFFFNTCHSDTDAGEGSPKIQFGPKQDTPIYPPADFQVRFDMVASCRDYYAQNVTTLDQLLNAVPKLVAQDPTVFAPDIFLRLRKDIQQQILCVMAFVRRPPDDEPSITRRRSKRLGKKRRTTINENLFPMLSGEKSLLWRTFSFLPLVDQHRLDSVQQVYLGLKYGQCRPLQRRDLFFFDYDLLDYEPQVAMKQFCMSTIVNRLSNMCQEQHWAVNQIDDQQGKKQAATSYLEQLKRVDETIQLYGECSSSDTTFGLMDPRVSPLQKHPLKWIREYVQNASQYDTIQEVLENALSGSAMGDE